MRLAMPMGLWAEGTLSQTPKELYRNHGMAGATFYAWKRKYGGMEVNEAKRLKALEEENRRLKAMVADLSLDNQMLKAVNGKNMVRPAAKREAVAWLREEFGVSERRACRVVGEQRSTQRYRPTERARPELKAAIREVAHAHPPYGYRRVHWQVVQRGFEVGQRLVRRIYAQEGLSVRRRRRRRLKSVARRPITPPSRPGERWSMDFVHDQLSDGRCFRVFAVVDDFTRQRVAMAVGTSLTSADAAVALARAVAKRGRPKRLVCDNGPEWSCPRKNEHVSVGVKSAKLPG